MLNYKTVFFAIFLISLMIMPVMALDEDIVLGTLGGTTESYVEYEKTGASLSAPFGSLHMHGAEYAIGTTGYVHFDEAGEESHYAAGSPSSVNSVPFNLLNITGDSVIARGTFGYMRNFDDDEVEIAGYQWLVFDSWENLTHIGGSGYFEIEINKTAAHLTSIRSSVNINTTSGYMTFGYLSGGVTEYGSVGNNVRLTSPTTYAEYTAVKPSGIGIEGVISKTHLGTTYMSKAYIFNADTDAVLGSDSTVNQEDFYFNILNQPIIIGIQDTALNWYNSSVLYFSAAPTPTPAPITGYSRTWFVTVDGLTGGTVYGSDINLLDVESGEWTNETDTEYGMAYIDTLPYHTINAYGLADEYTSTSRLGLDAHDNTIYELIIWTGLPDPGEDKVNLLVTVDSADTGSALAQVSVQMIVISTGLTKLQSTGQSGTTLFNAPNATALKITASKPGYILASKTITTTDFGPDSVRIGLKLATVTPAITTTPFPGEVTARPTVLPGCEDPDSLECAQAKDKGMMNQVRDFAPILITMACIMTLFYIMGGGKR